MAANPGQVMHGAIKAVVDMQCDCIKLFEDLEKYRLAGLKSFYGNAVALDLGQAMSRRRSRCPNPRAALLPRRG